LELHEEIDMHVMEEDISTPRKKKREGVVIISL